MMFCEFCAGLSICLLTDLTEIEFLATDFPQQAYYQHQPSYTDLIRSAENGCGLCNLIFQGFQKVITPESLSPEWEGKTRDEAASQVESQGETSDIKICINAEHLYTSENLGQVELFDVLLVQAGAALRIPTSPFSESEYSDDNCIPPLRLALNVPPEGRKRVGKYPVGRFQLDPDLGSPHNYNIARGWLEDCSTLHRNCSKNQIAKLPTRVIDVGLLDAENPRLVLSKGTEAKYTALSHCWGGVVSSLLTQGNLASYQMGIVLADLPANFRDAILITRQLGIRYLWIDSLCIIQDSREDWEAESKRMGSIYRDALVTISAATAHRSTDGFIKRSPHLGITHKSISLRLLTDIQSNETVEVSLKDDGEESLRELVSKSPLTKRGWTLQEEVLSPRILWYGERQIYWQCSEGFQSADGVPPGNLMPEDDAYSAISSLLHSYSSTPPGAIEPDLNLILDNYYRLIKHYSSRKLSYDSDKLPAFSGLAALLHPVLGGQYLAGIWSMDFRQGLIWWHEMGECRHTLSSQAPSWSWAVTNDPLQFMRPIRKSSTSVNDAQLLDYHVELKSQNTFGEVSSGYLVIKGFMMKLFRSSQVVHFSAGGVAQIFFDEDNPAEITDVFEFYSSEKGNHLMSIQRSNRVNGEEPRKQLEGDDINYDLISEQDYSIFIVETIPQDSDGVTATEANCLILKKSTDTDTYSRAGVLLTYPFLEDKFNSWIETWEQKTITIV